MKFEQSTIRDVSVVKVLTSRITADVAPAFKESLIGFMKDGPKLLVLDLSEVTFIDSSGLGALIGSLKVIGNSGELVLCSARDAVVSMFRLTRMDKVFRMFGDRAEAVAALSN